MASQEGKDLVAISGLSLCARNLEKAEVKEPLCPNLSILIWLRCLRVALPGGAMNYRTRVWPFELGLRNAMLWCGPFSWGDGDPRFGVAPLVGVKNTHA